MPCMIALCPRVLDQSFPIDDDELRAIAAGLGEIIQMLGDGKAVLAMTPVLCDLAESLDWNRPPASQTVLRDIRRLFCQWILQPTKHVVFVQTSSVCGHAKHPIPDGRQSDGLVEFWSDELGRLQLLHNSVCSDEAFLGIACASGFSGGTRHSYGESAGKAFPIVDLENLASLSDAFEWVLSHDLNNRSVTFDLAKRNCTVIGALRIEQPNSGSHYKVVFKNGSWPLDSNLKEIPDRFVKELAPITNLPWQVVKQTLLDGRLPPYRLKLDRCKESESKSSIP
jgi:hypothetical protein